MKSNTKVSIETLLTQPSYVTIQTLFQQHSIEEIGGIHKLVQENIRSQGIALKKIFESKYMDLVNCSQLLGKVNQFAQDIDRLAKDIKQSIKTDEESAEKVSLKAQGLVHKVEVLTRKGKFTEAVKVCLQHKEKERVLFQVVILETVEAALYRTKGGVTKNGLIDLLQALTLFMRNEGETYLTGEDVGQEYGIGLATLAKHFLRMKNKSVRSYLVCSLHSLFQIKIGQITIDKGKSNFGGFIDDLLSMVDIVQTNFKEFNIALDNEEEGHELISMDDIKDIYRQNFQKVKDSLSRQIIESKDKKISFNFDLYNAILADNDLIVKFGILENKLSGSNTIALVLGRLWSDFYRQFIAYVLSELNTFEWVYHEVSGIIGRGDLTFPQFARHLKDQFAANMTKQARKYKQTSNSLLHQLSELLKLCSKQDSESLLEYFRSQMKKSLDENTDSFVQLYESLSDNGQRLKTCIVTLTFQTYFIGSVLRLDNNQATKSIIEENQIKIEQALKTVLVEYAKNSPFHESIERTFQSLEELCMSIVAYLTQKEEKQSFKIFVLWLLESIALTVQGKNLEKVKFTQRYLTQKNVISHHEPLFHFIPSLLFGIDSSAQSRPFNCQYYETLLMSQPSNKVIITSRPEAFRSKQSKDLFDIGQKQQGTNNRVQNKPSLMAISSQFMQGLMSKISKQ